MKTATTSESFTKRKVLFICVNNTFRSPVAAALFRRRLIQEDLAATYEVLSAGTWNDEAGALGARPPAFDRLAKYPYGTNGLRALHHEHIHIQEHKSQLITPDQAIGAEVIVGMDRGITEVFRRADLLCGLEYKLLMLDVLDPGDGGSFNRFKSSINTLKDALNDQFWRILCLAEHAQS